MDDALDVAKTVVNGNANSALLVLEPLVHTMAQQMAITSKRRKLQDLVFASVAQFVFAVFNDLLPLVFF